MSHCMSQSMAGSLRTACHALGFDAAAAALRMIAPSAPKQARGNMTSAELLSRLEEMEAEIEGRQEERHVRSARELVEEQLWP